ncbi:hypothetical protein O2W14_02630 [Modestobacter sp. VKM Ac-2986]|uniref:hypothetical protein n=1 Tax=Modestobacter sp. VKM Ac-2986 TaxID=3004140 RepID=UPI0022AA117D|nr:hypothetical protein [Modestobacter sp. VKM Ac-2986]MCZ2827733.1 hypothetical protein [Modestobacter sp. VKM Ac-2986]
MSEENTNEPSRVTQKIRQLKGFAQDFPTVVNTGLGLAVVAYWLATWKWHHVNVPWLIDSVADPDHVMTLHLGVAALAAMVGGFSGVVIIFGLGDSTRLRRLRQSGGRRLHANWISVIAVAFAGAFLAVGCAGLALGGQPEPSLWIGMFAFLLTGHGAVRLVWLLGALAQVTHGEDEDRTRRENEIASADLFAQARAAREAASRTREMESERESPRELQG